MNANSAELARVFTAITGSKAQDITPNAGPPKLNRYDLIVQAEAGDVLGGSEANYTLTIDAFNRAGAVPGLNPAGSPFKEEFSDGDGWKRVNNSKDFLYEKVITITVPANTTGTGFYYAVSLITGNLQVISEAESNRFLLV